MSAAVTIRPMRVEDIAAGQRLSAGFHWPHRVEDWALMLELGEGVVAELDGAVAGTAMAWRYGADAATVGMIMVSEALQGRGIGRKLLQRLLDRLEGRAVRLNATPEGLKLYRALGFVEDGVITKYQADRVPALPAPDAGLRTLAASDLPWVAALDRAACGMDRTALLAALLAHGGGVGLEREGFALWRRFGRGQLVGPVVAPDGAAAERLIGQVLAPLAGSLVRIDVPERPGLEAWLAERGFVRSAPVVGMIRGGARPADTTIFAIASQAYG